MNTRLFPPSKRRGLLLHGLLLAGLAAATTWAVLMVARQPLGLTFAIYLLAALVAFAPVPLLAYRAYALFRAKYVLNRDSLELRWGLRDESIPLMDIEWVRPMSDLAHPLQVPAGMLPGAVIGLTRHRDLGVVEFMASEKNGLLLIATARRVYAISPSEPVEFAQTFARAVELGSLTTARGRSVYPSFVLAEAWRSGLTRFLWLANVFLNIGLIIWVSLLIPSLAQVNFAVGRAGASGAVPSTQLVILPLLSGFLSLIGWGAGLYYFRWEEQRVLSMVIWASNALMTLTFLLAVLFIISTPV
jgi:hypothetical protein